MKPFNLACFFVLVTLIVIPAPSNAAQWDMFLSYEGRLKVGGGAPNPNERFDLKLRLYNAATGGSVPARIASMLRRRKSSGPTTGVAPDQ